MTPLLLLFQLKTEYVMLVGEIEPVLKQVDVRGMGSGRVKDHLLRN